MKSLFTKVMVWSLLIGLTGAIIGCNKAIPPLDDQTSQNTDYVPCTNDDQCEKDQTCDTSDCLSCCPNSTGPCIDLCCGKCTEPPSQIECTTDADCTYGAEWCEYGICVACDNSGAVCDLFCSNGMIDPRNGCQPCTCNPDDVNCEDQTYSRACKEDGDCTCGINVITKECDYGIAECIDVLQQCPDFCTGIAGNLKIVCKDNQCVQVVKPTGCTTDADCTYGIEWCENGLCVPCDNNGKTCTILCVLVEPRNGCQPCKCQTSYTPCTSADQCGPGQICNRSECLSCCPNSTGPCIDLCCGKCVDAAGGFCGWSTNGPCASDADCMTGGCSGQVCQSTSEDPIITTCEWTDCYAAKAYGVSCGCLSSTCQWK
jgi:eight-cysteine-cluster-containing protein